MTLPLARLERAERRLGEQPIVSVQADLAAVGNGTATLDQYARQNEGKIAFMRDALVASAPLIVERLRRGDCPSWDIDVVGYPPDCSLPPDLAHGLSVQKAAATDSWDGHRWWSYYSGFATQVDHWPVQREMLALRVLALGREPEAFSLRREIFETQDRRWVLSDRVSDAGDRLRSRGFRPGEILTYAAESAPCGHHRCYAPTWSDSVISVHGTATSRSRT